MEIVYSIRVELFFGVIINLHKTAQPSQAFNADYYFAAHKV